MILQDIKLILFSSKIDKHFKKISDVVTEEYPKFHVFKCVDLDNLCFAMRGTLSGFGIVVIIARSRDELNNLLSMNNSLKEHLLILVLDNSVDGLIDLALKFHPRYTSYFKDEYTDVSLVLNKMITIIQSRIEGRGR